ncbi:hypothetical protein [Nonomuraea typhae]|uniref:Uncharacterized protein n=1 Tax=Nonomuraea typhae TaxID=2603600 RepID=A0ABW7YS46_9ACTN
MNYHDSVLTYAQMLQADGGWLAEELAWTVLMPTSGTLPLNEVAQRVARSNQPAFVEGDFEDAAAANAVVVEATGDGAMVVDINMIAATPDPEFVAEISTNAKVWHVSWHTALSRRMIYAVNRRVLAVIPLLDPAEAFGEDLSAIQPELDALADTQTAPWPTTEATALSLIETRTGARLSLDWFEQPHRAVTVSY